MSIDARVQSVHLNEDGSGKLCLMDRPPIRKGATPGIAGQNALHFDRAPEEVTSLNGRDIWGGDSQIMLGDVEIARRDGYTGLVFHDAETLKRAIARS
jgi:hypothetical protein